MDPLRFDVLARSLTVAGSRRRSLLVALSGALGLLGLPGALSDQEVAAHNRVKACRKIKNNKKKRAKCLRRARKHNRSHNKKGPLGVPCPVGTKPCRGGCISTNLCCTDADCPAAGDYHCCGGVCDNIKRPASALCGDGGDSICCSGNCRVSRLTSVTNEVKICWPNRAGNPCTSAAGCDGLPCSAVGPDQTLACGGCLETGQMCQSNADCCFSNCTTLNPDLPAEVAVCGSLPGGPCSVPYDCLSCRFDFETCNEVCVAGVCACPEQYQCCSSGDCPPEFPPLNCNVDDLGLNGVCEPPVIEG